MRENLVAFLHFINQPTEREQNLFRIGHDRKDKMRQRVVHLHLDHFRIDHNEAQFLRSKTKEHARDKRVDADALAAPGRAGDEQVRHLREIGDNRFPVDIFAQREREFDVRLRFLPILRLQKFAQRHFHFACVRQLDADGVFARNRRENVDALRAGGAGQIALEAHDFIYAHTFRRINFVARDGGTLRDIACRNRNPELPKRFDQRLLNSLQLGGIGCGSSFGVVFVKQIQSGQRVILRVPGATR